MNGSKSEVHVFVNRGKVEFDSLQVSGEELLAKAGFAGSQWDLLSLQGEGDPSGGTVVMFNDSITLKSGDHFRVIPGNRTFGA